MKQDIYILLIDDVFVKVSYSKEDLIVYADSICKRGNCAKVMKAEIDPYNREYMRFFT